MNNPLSKCIIFLLLNSLLQNPDFLTPTDKKAFENIVGKGENDDSFFLCWQRNVVGKEENAYWQHFLLFPQCFPNDL